MTGILINKRDMPTSEQISLKDDFSGSIVVHVEKKANCNHDAERQRTSHLGFIK